jgi:hypothetical protein
MTFLKTEYGGVRNYLRGIGLSDDELDSILTMVVEPVTKS